MAQEIVALNDSTGQLEVVKSTNQFLQPYDFQLAVSRGLVAGHTSIFRSAYSNSVTTTTSTLWPKGTVYSFPSSASTMTLSSSSTSDTTQPVLIQGLDSTYASISEVLTLNGQNPVTTVNSYLRINTLTVLTDSPQGNISLGTGTVTAGVPANTYGYVAALDNVSSAAVYTVPKGYTLYILSGSISAGGSTGSQTVTGKFYSKINGVLYLTSDINLANNFQFFPYTPPVSLPEKTDTYNNVISSSNTLSVSATFNGILIAN